MIIDIHTHTFPDKIAANAIAGMEKAILDSQGFRVRASGDGMFSSLCQSTKESKIDLTLVAPVATKPHQAMTINRLSVDINDKRDENHVFYMGAIHPDCENYKEVLDEIVAMDLKGIKIHPDYQKAYFNDDNYLRIMDYAAEKGLAIIVHAGEDIGLPQKIHCTPDMVLDVWKHIQPEKLVLAHMGGWRMWDEVEEKLIGLPVYFDTAVCLKKDVPHLSDEQFVRIIRKHGADKILFGTDWPWYNQKQALEDINHTGLTQNEKELILGDNTRKLLDICV